MSFRFSINGLIFNVKKFSDFLVTLHILPIERCSEPLFSLRKIFFKKGLYKTKIVCYIISNKNHY